MDQVVHRRRLRRVGFHLAAAVVVIAAAGCVLRFTPLRIPCPLYSLFGLQCPFCGGTRMAEALLRFDFAGAFFHNPYLMIALPLAALLLLIREWRYLRSGTTRTPVWMWGIWIGLAAAGILFGLIRNMI